MGISDRPARSDHTHAIDISAVAAAVAKLTPTSTPTTPTPSGDSAGLVVERAQRIDGDKTLDNAKVNRVGDDAVTGTLTVGTSKALNQAGTGIRVTTAAADGTLRAQSQLTFDGTTLDIDALTRTNTVQVDDQAGALTRLVAVQPDGTQEDIPRITYDGKTLTIDADNLVSLRLKQPTGGSYAINNTRRPNPAYYMGFFAFNAEWNGSAWYRTVEGAGIGGGVDYPGLLGFSPTGGFGMVVGAAGADGTQVLAYDSVFEFNRNGNTVGTDPGGTEFMRIGGSLQAASLRAIDQAGSVVRLVSVGTTGKQAALANPASSGSYGSASETLTATIDLHGRVTAMADTPIQIAEAQVTDLPADLSDIFARLAALEYVLPDISGLSNSVGTVEKGTTVNTVPLSWTLNKVMTTESISAPGPGAITPTLTAYSVTGLSLTSDQSFTVTVGDGTNTDAATTSVLFRNKRRWGVSATATADAALIDALAGSEFSTSRAQTRSMTGAAEYLYFAWPSTFGTPSFTVNGLPVTGWVQTVVSYTNPSGFTENYDVWRSQYAQTGTFTVVVS